MRALPPCAIGPISYDWARGWWVVTCACGWQTFRREGEAFAREMACDHLEAAAARSRV